jgi:hypothetical protein
MKACPRCELLNPDDGTVCACGFDLVHGDAGGVRGVLRRRGRAYQLGGLVLIAFGLAGGTAFLPIHISVFFNIQSYRADLGMIIAGGLLLARGGRLVYRPWTEPASEKRTG